MFQRDYLMRILQTFFKDLDVLLHGKHYPDDEQQLEAIGGMYHEYLKNDRSHYYETAIDDLLASFRNDPDGIYKAEMLAALLYNDALLQNNTITRKELLTKSRALYQYIDAQSKDFSMERKEMIDAISGLLEDV